MTNDSDDVFFERHVAPRVVVSYSRRFVYFRIPKVGNSSVMASLFQAEHQRRFLHTKEFNRFKRNYFSSFIELLGHDREKVFSEHFSFVFIRDPFSRLLSAYFEKISRTTREGEMVRQSIGRSSDDAVSFDEFLTYLESGGVGADPHWAPQSKFIRFPLSQFDFVGDMSNLTSGLENVLSQIYGEYLNPIEYRPHATGSSDRVVEMISEVRARKIRALYEDDFALYSQIVGC